MKRLPSFAIALILLLCFIHVKHDRWPKDYGAWTTVINSDGYGYVAYLPAIILRHNLDYKSALHAVTKVRQGLSDANIDAPIIDIDEKHQLNKCFVGIAVLLLPFFLLTCLIAKFSGFDIDGFSYPFQLSVSIAGLFYLFIGLLYLYKLLKLYNIKDLVICFVLFTVVFATNLYYYVTMEPSMPHIYDFSMVTVFLYFAKKSIDDFRLKYFIWVAISLGVLIIIRPTNILVVLTIPFLIGGLKETGSFISGFLKSKVSLIASVVLLMVVGLQFIMWHAQTGHWYVWSYPGEGFNFKQPHFIDILFSYRKGWFVYTPLMFFMLLASFILLYKYDRFRFLSAMFFFIVITYVFSSWWYWAYGGSFGSRPFIDYYSFFAVVFSISVNKVESKWYKIVAFIIAILCIELNTIQTRQYENFIIPTDGMTKSGYWEIFLKTDVEYMGWWEPKDVEKDYNFIDNYSFSNDFENNTWGGSNDNITCAYAHSGKHSAFSNSTLVFSPGFQDSVSALPKVQQGRLSLYTSFWIYMPDRDNDSKLVVSLEETGKPAYFWYTVGLSDMVDSCNKWVKIQHAVELPDFKNGNDILKTMIYTTVGIVYIDDVEVKFGVHK